MFEYNDKDWDAMLESIGKDLTDDITQKIMEDMPEPAVQDLFTSGINILKYEPMTKAIESDDMGAKIVNEGVIPGTFPNFDKIMEWVKYKKDGGANRDLSEYKIKQIAYKVAKGIKDKGIEPTWFIDRALAKIEGEHA